MTTDRIKEIQAETAYPNSTSVQQALLKVWNECEQEQKQVKNCNKPVVRESALDAFDRGFTAGYNAGVKMGLAAD